MGQVHTGPRSTAGRMFSEQPERMAAAWRRERYAETGRQGAPDNLLDGCIEAFVREIGLNLMGASGPAWSRTRGVLKLSTTRGTRALYEEFGAVRRCLLDALHVVDAPASEQHAVIVAVDEAVDCAIAMCRRLREPTAPQPRITFGGLMVEVIEPAPRPHVQPETGRLAATH